MWRKDWILSCALLAVAVVGCGGSDSASRDDAERGQQDTSAQSQGPEAAVGEFLDAIRSGDDEKTARMLTAAARRTTSELGLVVAPPGSDTAEFEVGKAEYVSKDGARVPSKLSDLDGNAQRQTEELIWLVRREPDGWRIAGVAASMVQGEEPRVVNFEDRDAMAAMSGRPAEGPPTQPPGETGGPSPGVPGEAADLQAQGPKDPADAIRR